MKEYHQTPRKDRSHRRSKDSPSPNPIPDDAKKTPKITTKKSLNAEFTFASGDFPTESVTDSFTLSPISEVLNDNQNGESIDSSEWLFPADNSSSPAVDDVLTPLDSISSSKITAVAEEFTDISSDWLCKSFISHGTIEVDLVANNLKQARLQVLRSTDINAGSKKLLDALIEVSLKEFYGFPYEEDKIDVIISNRGRVRVFAFLVWLVIICLSMIRLCGGLGTRSSSSFFPPPT